MADFQSRYVLVSPVKDEAQYVGETLASVSRQTIPPARWVIVDDGSSDRTAAIVEEYASRVSWITLIRSDGGAREPCLAVIRAFNRGIKALGDSQFDFIVKLDCDLRFAPDYFERLLTRFHADARLGIVSGVYREMRNGKISIVAMPVYHAAGASKMVRAACFRDIGGFVPERGWDTVDEIRAQFRGWSTGHLDDAVIDHLKPEGSATGPIRTNMMHGEVAYRTGGGCALLLAKLMTRVFRGKPPLLAAAALFYGFLRAAVLRKPRLVSPPEARHYRFLLKRRFFARLRQPPEWLLSLGSRLFWRFS